MVTYNYLLPDDWAQVRLDPLDRSSVKQLTDRMFADIDDEVTRVRVSGWVTSRMTTQLEEIASRGAWAEGSPAGRLTPASSRRERRVRASASWATPSQEAPADRAVKVIGPSP